MCSLAASNLALTANAVASKLPGTVNRTLITCDQNDVHNVHTSYVTQATEKCSSMNLGLLMAIP